jgi:hypothetical protein
VFTLPLLAPLDGVFTLSLVLVVAEVGVEDSSNYKNIVNIVN